MKSLEIGIVSDSHGRLAALETMAARNPAVDVWFHCGDYCEDAEALALCTAAPVYTVLGNKITIEAPKRRKNYGRMSEVYVSI